VWRGIFESAIPVVSAVGHEIDSPSAIRRGRARSDAERGGGNHYRRRVRQPQLVADLDAAHGAGASAPAHERAFATIGRFADRFVALHEAGDEGTAGAWQNLATRLLRVRPAQLLRQRRESWW